MKTKLITLVIAAGFFALLAVMQADDKDKSNHTITLVCSTGGFGGREAAPTMIDLDEAQGVVTIYGGAVYLHSGEILTARSTGPLKARFTKNTITFVERSGDRVDEFTINRLTGIVDIIWKNASGKALDAANHYQVRYQYTCHVGKAQF
jgi:hypothetical protein